MTSHEQPSRPSRSLLGKVAIVTGGGTEGNGIGNGRAISLLLAEDGAAVLCADLNQSAAEGTAKMIEAEGKGKAMAYHGDVSKEHDCEAIVNTALKIFGRVDILVNSVGIIGAKGTAVNVQAADWSTGLEINVTSMMLMAKYAIPAMLQNQYSDGSIRGSIINLGSVAGLQGGTPSLLYPTSKGAVVNMTRAMAANHAREGIRVNCVCPGRALCVRFSHRVLKLTGTQGCCSHQ